MNAQAAKDTATTTIVKPPYMQNRELSWLTFNERVLDHVNGIACSACGGRHDTDYDETMYY